MIRYSTLGSSLLVGLVCSSALLVVVACGSDGAASNGGAGATALAGAGGHLAGASAGGAGAGGSAGAVATGQAGSAATAGSGAGGAGNAGGSTSSAGAPGSSMGGGAGAMPSAGCGMVATQALHSWVEQPKMMVKGVARQWWLWLPSNYQASKPYPVVFLFHGCGSPDNVVPMQNATNDQAILVRGAGINDGCWDQGPDGVDMTFFDQMLEAVSAQRCADTKRIFAVGYSSGSWLVNSLDCRRASKLRGAASVSGGVQSNKCSGEIARIFIHDSNDPNNDISGSLNERKRLIEANHCTMTTLPDEPSPCVRYQGCDAGYPIDWCQTMGKLHDRQDSLAPTAFWKFFSGL